MDDSLTTHLETHASDPATRQPQQTHRLHCPRCSRMSGVLGAEQSAEERADLPDGLAAITAVMCENNTCLYEWEAVTRGQILRSMRGWQGQSAF